MEQFIPQLIGTGITLLVIFILRELLKRMILKYAGKSARSEHKINHIIRVCMIFINTVGAVTLIAIWGVHPRNILIAISSVFAMVGIAFFAQWSILSNVTAGIILYFTNPFRVGDYIRIMDKEIPLDAQVEEIYTFYTHLRTKDGTLHLIPNALLLQKGISILEGL